VPVSVSVSWGGVASMKYLLWGIVLCYLLIASVYNFVVTPGGGPDEVAHLKYIKVLALEHRLPQAAETHQAQHPPLYYALGAVVYVATPFLSEDGRLHAIRFLSLLLGLASLLLIGSGLAALFPDKPALLLLSVGTMAFHPLFSLESGVINNDLLATFAFSLFIYLLMISLKNRSFDKRISLYMGLATGIGFLAKQTSFVMPFLFAVLLWRKRSFLGINKVLNLAGVFALTALAISGWWYALNYLRYGRLIYYSCLMPMQKNMDIIMLLANLDLFVKPISTILQRTIISFWAPLWIIRRFFDDLHIYIAAAFLLPLLPIAGIIRLARQHRSYRNISLLLLSVVVFTLAGIIYYALTVDYRAVEGGRYLLAALPAVAILIGSGFSTLLPRRFALPLAIVILLAMLAGDIYCLSAARLYHQLGLHV
jgi:4-amino-4-deoxy-L-arabinose transferase-like glycosyltransferase